MSLEKYVIDCIEGRRKAPFFRLFLWVSSLLFGVVTRLRNFCYDRGILRSYRSKLVTVSIGNIVAGGSGKTPTTLALVEALSFPAGAIAILSRGYRREKKGRECVVSCGQGPLCSVEEGGDEPYLLARKTSACVLVGHKRASLAKKAQALGAQLLILEDGFQHRALQRDIEIVLLDGRDLWGKSAFLPYGFLRDDPKRLAKADWIVITHWHPACPWEEIRSFSQAPLMGMQPVYHLPEACDGALVGAFCGIAHPFCFYEELEKRGCTIVAKRSCEDHKGMSIEELSIFAARCKAKGASALICTEKDRVKYPLSIELALPLCCLTMRFTPVWQENHWKEMCDAIQNKKKPTY